MLGLQFVKAIFHLGVLSVDDDDSNTNAKGVPDIEFAFEAVLSNASWSPGELQVIAASLANGEAGAQVAVNVSRIRTVRFIARTTLHQAAL